MCLRSASLVSQYERSALSGVDLSTFGQAAFGSSAGAEVSLSHADTKTRQTTAIANENDEGGDRFLRLMELDDAERRTLPLALPRRRRPLSLPPLLLSQPLRLDRRRFGDAHAVQALELSLLPPERGEPHQR